jgi:hypothetical protein
MSRAGRAKRRCVGVALGTGLVVVGSLAAPASAAAVTTDCAGLQAAITGATSGETIDLTELCALSNSGGTFTFPTQTGVTIEGAGAGDGFDGTGVNGPALHGPALSGLTLRNLTFENYSLTNISNGGSSAVQLQLPASGALPVIDHDSFVNNTSTSNGVPVGAGLDIFGVTSNCSYTGPLTISSSLFSGNVLATSSLDNSAGTGATGGGASIAFDCGASTTASLLITGNTFRQNSIRTAGAGAYGAGLYAANAGGSQLTATQSGNVFESNTVVNTGSIATTFNGGGEWLASVNLTSSSDAYIGNSLPGPGSGSASEGAGLGAVRSSCSSSTVTTTATATNLVAAGNSIGTPSGGDVEGGGVYAGCEALQGSQGFQLTLVDSTVSGNSGPGGAAGVDGESGDTLTLRNSIVAGNTGAGAGDLGGFGAAPGANVTAADSDVCAIGTANTPFPGTGNICADPLLASAATGDVHETAASPTIDAGSNALVPSGVGADFYGQPRIVGTKQAQGIVDIGAAEDQTAFTPPSGPPAPPSAPSPPPPRVHLTKAKAAASGVDVTIRCAGTASQRCSGRIMLTTVETRLGPRVIAVASAAAGKPKRRRVTVSVAGVRYRLAGGRSMTVHVKLNRTGGSLLARFRALPVKVTLRQAGRSKPVATRKLKIRVRRPKSPGH